jgi:hypothetical protein
MGISRRDFIAALGGSLWLTPLLAGARSAESAAPRVQYLSARAGQAGAYFVSGFDASGQLCFDLPLPGRGHGLTVSPGLDQAVLVARRPGNFLVVLDLAEGRVARQLEGGADRHFYGHGVFSADGRWLYTPENDYDAGRGVIGVRDVQQGYRRVAELPAHGIGPHDVKLLSDGHTLVVANGGILTHPDTPRAKLNLDSMQPSLTYLDVRNGELLEQQRLAEELHQNSIRHLAVTADDRVCFVMQYQGPRGDRPPLVGLHRRGGEVQLCQAPAQLQAKMRNYCGSVAADSSGQCFAVSSPRGNLVTFWSAEDGRLLGHEEVADGCGIASGGDAGEFLLSSGQGEVWRYSLRDGAAVPLELSLPGARWDNHMAGLAG